MGADCIALVLFGMASIKLFRALNELGEVRGFPRGANKLVLQ